MEKVDDFLELAEEIEARSSYQKKNTKQKTMMTVREMGDLLGLKKTDRYWLLHKGFFKSKEILGKTWIEIASFEKWYANQVKYKKVTGEEPGKELKERSYSIRDLAEELGITEDTVYCILKREEIETITVDYWRRVPKDAWDRWYRTQNKYRMKADRERDAEIEEATITMPEMARLLGITRSKVYAILRDPRYKDSFEIIVVAQKKGITKESFQRFLAEQDKYWLDTKNEYTEVTREPNRAVANYWRRVLAKSNTKKGIGNQKYLTRKEAAILAKEAPNTISAWCEKGCFPVKYLRSEIRIQREVFELFLEKRANMGNIVIPKCKTLKALMEEYIDLYGRYESMLWRTEE